MASLAESCLKDADFNSVLAMYVYHPPIYHQKELKKNNELFQSVWQTPQENAWVAPI